MIYIGKSKIEKRVLHWQDITHRVTTHEGEFLRGEKGKRYQEKYGKKYLGKDLSRPVNFDKSEYQRELEKT